MIDPTLCCDSDGDTPLHWALEGYVSPRRIKELTRSSKSAIMAMNDAGKRPFDKFAENYVDPDWKLHDVVGRADWENIQAYLHVLFDEENSRSTAMVEEGDESRPEWLPLHHLAGSVYSLPLVFLDIALHFCKDDLSKMNSRGMLPLHLACRRRNIDSDILCDGSVAHKILAAYPQAAYKAVAGTLIKSYPRSLNLPDPITRLWPFVLAGVENDVSMTTSFTLLRADPSILSLALKDDRKKKSQQRTKELMAQMAAEAELEDQSSRRIRRLTIRDPYGT
ncbi:MAG: hypothetical protein SGARI_003336 [Bacillariaceae sp.]